MDQNSEDDDEDDDESYHQYHQNQRSNNNNNNENNYINSSPEDHQNHEHEDMSDYAEDDEEDNDYQQLQVPSRSQTPSASLLNRFYHASTYLEFAGGAAVNNSELNIEESKENNSADSNKPVFIQQPVTTAGFVTK